jgi:hypothetical protein
LCPISCVRFRRVSQEGQRREENRTERERTSHHLEKVGIMSRDEEKVKGKWTEGHEWSIRRALCGTISRYKENSTALSNLNPI